MRNPQISEAYFLPLEEGKKYNTYFLYQWCVVQAISEVLGVDGSVLTWESDLIEDCGIIDVVDYLEILLGIENNMKHLGLQQDFYQSRILDTWRLADEKKYDKIFMETSPKGLVALVSPTAWFSLIG